MSTTLLLDPTTWDLTLDEFGNIATVSGAYALAQTAANAIRTFLGEVWYNNGVGVPYWQSILGLPASRPIVQLLLWQAAMSVQGVTAAVITIEAITNRVLTGTVTVTDKVGATASIAFGVGGP